jgi:bifunctional non-homologous end joining protein LigD
VSSPGDRLAGYRAKRRFEVTPEPEPRSSQTDAEAEKKTSGASAGSSGDSSVSGLAFVVQKHDARRLHYDLRLEIDSAMVSWAVPKGPSYDPKVRRLAVQTEDHPMGYNSFEGRIPDGEYGAGDVLIWDRGTFETVPPGAEHAMLEKGHIHFRLFGSKLVGQWHLVRTAGRGGDDGAGGGGKAQWLLFKARDADANPAYDVVADRPESVVSGRLATRGPLRVGASESGKSAQTLFATVGSVALAKAVASIANPEAWLFEIKYDGYRIVACKSGSDLRLFTRRGHDWTDRFRLIAESVAKLGVRECVLDGEACVVDDRGRPSFAKLQEWLGGGGQGALLAYAVFDILWLDGRDRKGDPIEARREILARLLDGQPAPLSLSRSVEGDVPDLLRAARQAGLEGLVAKKKGSTYASGRSGTWLKIRFDRRQDCAIIGYIPLAGTDDQVGALLLAVVEGDTFVFAGRVGTGFDAKMRRDLAKRLDGGKRLDHPPIESAPRTKDAHWVEPALVCECAFTEWTRDGSMRHPRFFVVREDKTPVECIRDGEVVDDRADDHAAESEPRSPAATPAPAVVASERAAPAVVASEPAPGKRPKLSNPAKVLFPRDGLTKRDVWDYYTAIAGVMVAHLAGRPLTLQRYPNGIDGQEWYQQNIADKTPEFVRLVDTGPRHEGKKRIVADNVETLQWLANLAALTIHQWCSHVPRVATTRSAIDRALAQPDYVVLDLDPGDGPWAHLVEVARAVKKLLDALELESFVKTSGKRGVHVVVPIAPGPTHSQATGFAEQVARAVSKVLPKIATVERMKDKRGGKLYVDYGQNGEGRTVVAPYSIRARDGAIVSTPIEWDELDEALDPSRFDIRTVVARVQERGDLFAGVLRGTQTLPKV